MNQKGLLNTPLIIVLVLIIVASFLLLKPYKTVHNDPSQEENASAQSQSWDYPSYDKKFILTYKLTKDKDKSFFGDFNCQYEIKDSSGSNLTDKVIKLLGHDSLTCSDLYGAGFVPGNFISWANDGKVLFEFSPGTVKILDLRELKARDYNYDSKNLVFRLTDKDLKYWLFAKSSKAGGYIEYVLLDKDGEVTIETIEAITNDGGVIGGKPFYDPDNNGFLFVSSIAGEVQVEVGNGKGETWYENVPGQSLIFSYLDLQNLELKKLLTTKVYQIIPSTCGLDGIETKKREIIYRTSCLNIQKGSDSYSDDYSIHLKVD